MLSFKLESSSFETFESTVNSWLDSLQQQIDDLWAADSTPCVSELSDQVPEFLDPSSVSIFDKNLDLKPMKSNSTTSWTK